MPWSPLLTSGLSGRSPTCWTDLLSGFLCHSESGAAAQARSGELPDRPEARRRSRPPGTGHRGQHSRLSGSAPGRNVQRRLFERRKKYAGTGGYGCHHRPDGGAFIPFIKLNLDFHAAGRLLPARFFVSIFCFPRSMLDFLFTLDSLSLHSSAVPLHGRSHITSPVVLLGRGFLCVPPHRDIPILQSLWKYTEMSGSVIFCLLFTKIRCRT